MDAKIGPKRLLGAVLGGWEAERAQEPKGNQKVYKSTPEVEPKLIKIGFKSHPKGDHFFDRSLDRLLERFGANLAPNRPPKPSQNGAKLEQKSVQVEVLI